MNFLQKLFIQPLQDCYERFLTFIPGVFTSIVLLIIGIIAGIIIRVIFLKIFRATNLDGLAGRIGLLEILTRSGIKGPLSALGARLLGWLVILVFAIVAVQTLRIPAVEELLQRFLLFLPSAFMAIIILLIGYLLGSFFGRAALIASINAGLRQAGLIGKLVKTSIFILSATMAIEQLGIGRETVLTAFAIIFGGIVLALSISFGLGGRHIAGKLLRRNVHHEEKEGREDNENIDPL